MSGDKCLVRSLAVQFVVSHLVAAKLCANLPRGIALARRLQAEVRALRDRLTRQAAKQSTVVDELSAENESLREQLKQATVAKESVDRRLAGLRKLYEREERRLSEQTRKNSELTTALQLEQRRARASQRVDTTTSAPPPPRSAVPPNTSTAEVAPPPSATAEVVLPRSQMRKGTVDGSSVSSSKQLEDCGVCEACLDKRKFGGVGKKRKRCFLKGSAAARPAAVAPMKTNAATQGGAPALEPAALAADTKGGERGRTTHDDDMYGSGGDSDADGGTKAASAAAVAVADDVDDSGRDDDDDDDEIEVKVDRDDVPVLERMKTDQDEITSDTASGRVLSGRELPTVVETDVVEPQQGDRVQVEWLFGADRGLYEGVVDKVDLKINSSNDSTGAAFLHRARLFSEAALASHPLHCHCRSC